MDNQIDQTIEQRTAEWKQLRAGRFTGSRFVDVLARNKRTGEPLKAYHDLLWEIAIERFTGHPVEGATGHALQWGSDVEPFGKEAYELETGFTLVDVPFVIHPKYDFVGVSPDSLIEPNRGMELKCPKSPIIHAQRFIDGMPDDFKPQVQGNLWCTGRDIWDFASYHPQFPVSHQLFIQTFERDEPFIKTLEDAILEANEKVKTILKQLIERKAA